MFWCERFFQVHVICLLRQLFMHPSPFPFCVCYFSAFMLQCLLQHFSLFLHVGEMTNSPHSLCLTDCLISPKYTLISFHSFEFSYVFPPISSYPVPIMTYAQFITALSISVCILTQGAHHWVLFPRKRLVPFESFTIYQSRWDTWLMTSSLSALLLSLMRISILWLPWM